MEDLTNKIAEDLFYNGGQSMHIVKIDDNGNITQEHIPVDKWRNTHKQEDSVSERLKLAEKLKNTGFKIELDKRIHSKRK